MKPEDLQRLTPGFADPVMGSQAVFRRALQALSLPGRPVELPRLAHLPTKGHATAALLFLTLLDSDCTLWLSPRLEDSDARAWLRFHTGCRYTNDPSQAGFLWLAAGDEWPLLETLNVGCDEYPDQSATCVMELDALHGEDAERWMLQGPGIDGSIQLTTRGLPPNFGEQWARNHSLFPRGVDVFLASPTQIVGLPRTTRLYKKTSVEH